MRNGLNGLSVDWCGGDGWCAGWVSDGANGLFGKPAFGAVGQTGQNPAGMMVSDNHLGTGGNDREHVAFWYGGALEFGVAFDENREFSDAFFETEIHGSDGGCGDGEPEREQGRAVVAGESPEADRHREEADAGVENIQGLVSGGEEATEEKFG